VREMQHIGSRKEVRDMKTIFRLSMAMAVAALFIWGGVAQSEEFAVDPFSYEYLVGIETGTLPSIPVASRVLVEVEAPEPGTWEHSGALETGNLPAMCGDMPCEADNFTIIESGGIPFRVEVDI
jgi:hypothetical protein